MRRNRSIALTPAAQVYVRDVRSGLSQLQAATDRLRATRSRDTIRLMAYATFGMRWLIPRLAGFKAKYPTIAVDLTTSLDRVSFESRDFDLAIRSGPRTWPQMRSEVLPLKSALTPVCSPALLERGLAEPAELANHTLLHSLAMPGRWAEWLEAAGAAEVPLQGGLRFESSSMCYEAALSGAGVALARPVFVAPELAAGKLVTPFPAVAIPHDADYLIYSGHRAERQALQAFRSWLLHEAVSPPPAPAGV